MNKFWNNLMWLVIGAVVFMIIFTLWTNPNTTFNLKNKLLNSQNSQSSDPIIAKAINNFKECKGIVSAKSDIQLELIKSEKISNYNDALIFYKTWSNPVAGLGAETEIDKVRNYPIVMIAIRVEYNGNAAPLVAITDIEGNLTSLSKTILSC